MARRQRRQYDVFGRPRPGSALTHLGSLEAPDDEFASLYATQAFGRRGENIEFVVTPRDSLAPCSEYERVFEHHAFRRVDGYSRRRWLERKLAEGAGSSDKQDSVAATDKEINSLLRVGGGGGK